MTEFTGMKRKGEEKQNNYGPKQTKTRQRAAQQKSATQSARCFPSLSFGLVPNRRLGQNLFLNRISKLKLLLCELSCCVDACSYCATKERRSDTRYSTVII